MTELPPRPWSVVEIDFSGLFPNGKYAPVITDQYSRYPKRYSFISTVFDTIRKKLRRVSATHEFPKLYKLKMDPHFPLTQSQTSQQRHTNKTKKLATGMQTTKSKIKQYHDRSPKKIPLLFK